MPTPPVSVQKLAWTDPPLGSIDLPTAPLVLRASFGSGLALRAGDPPGRVWAVGDRGPNLKVKDARQLYGAEHLARLADVSGAKIMPRLDLGPEIAELQVLEDRVELLRVVRLSTDGRPVSGLPVPGSAHTRTEPVFDLQGNPLAPDPDGLDTEGIAALPDGGFWLGDEFGPSLVRVDGEGRIQRRLVPEGTRLETTPPAEPRLPAVAARRQINRGFEALALAPDGSLLLAFQSPLAHPDETAHEAAAHVRLWRLDEASGTVLGQWLYPLDPPESFARDTAAGEFERKDVKVSEIACLGGEAILVLERGSFTTKLYRVSLDEGVSFPPEQLDPAVRPTLEERSGAGEPLPALAKELLFTSDDHPGIGRDMEGLAILSPTELLLVSDNDFGVEGAHTEFYRLRFEASVLA